MKRLSLLFAVGLVLFTGLPARGQTLADANPDAAALPVVNLKATAPGVNAAKGQQAIVLCTRTGDLSEKLVVAFSIRGSAQNGHDYQPLAKTVTLKANKAKAKIRITPIDSTPGHVIKTIRLKLKGNAAYQPGTDAVARIVLVYGG